MSCFLVRTRTFVVLILVGIARFNAEEMDSGSRTKTPSYKWPFIDTVSYKTNAEVVLNVTFYKYFFLGPIPQKAPLNQSATLPPPTVEISTATDLPPRPTNAQAENITTGTPAVVTNT